MDVRTALKEQYHAGLKMLDQCVDRCPEDLWISGTFPRSYWRIAFHAVYFSHLYLGQGEDAFQPWPDRKDDFPGMWRPPFELEPYELPAEASVYSREEIREYISFVDGLLDPTVDALDLDTDQSGFSWYPRISKLSHQILNVRHIQGHVGQLSELLMARDIDIDWSSRG